MNLFYVCQNKTYKQESSGQYLWSPQKQRNGRNNKGYTNMATVKKGDVIFHGAKQETYAISVAKEDCYEADQPYELKYITSEKLWDNNGYRVDCDYIKLTNPLDMKQLFSWFKDHYKKDSAFTKDGECKQIYLNNIDKNHANFIVKQILDLQQNIIVKRSIECIFKDMLEVHNSEYADYELNEINEIVNEVSISDSKVTWKGQKLKKEFINSSGTGKSKPKRNSRIAANALIIAKHLCEYNRQHRVFIRKDGMTNYTEPHHLIPMSNHRDFSYNLDVEENIVSLCSYCHNLLHYGRLIDKQPILKKIFEERQAALANVGLELNKFEDLLKYYI